MIKKVVPITDPCLRIKSKPVKIFDKKIASLIKDLKDTLVVQKDPEGVGLAAPQIGKNLQIFAIKPKDKITVIVNPKIISQGKAMNMPRDDNGKKIMEGCLSLPHYYGPLRRPDNIKIKYLDENGKETIKTFVGLEAQIVEHEIDHLNGIVFVNRLLEQKIPLYEYIDGEWDQVDLIM